VQGEGKGKKKSLEQPRGRFCQMVYYFSQKGKEPDRTKVKLAEVLARLFSPEGKEEGINTRKGKKAHTRDAELRDGMRQRI